MSSQHQQYVWLQRKPDGGDRLGAATFQTWDSIITGKSERRCFSRLKRMPGNSQGFQRARELLAAVICLRALHSLSTETFSKEQEWKGTILGFECPFCHLALIFAISSKTGWEIYLLLLQISAWKSRGKRALFPQKGWQWLLWSITLQKKVHFLAQHFWEQSHRKFFSREITGGVWVDYRAQKISQPQKHFWASK